MRYKVLIRERNNNTFPTVTASGEHVNRQYPFDVRDSQVEVEAIGWVEAVHAALSDYKTTFESFTATATIVPTEK